MKWIPLTLVLAACWKPAEIPTKTPPPPPAATPVATPPSSDPGLACLVQGDLDLNVGPIVQEGPIEYAHIVSKLALARARDQGIDELKDELSYQLEWFLYSDDVEGLRAVLAFDDKLPMNERAPGTARYRARVGMPVPKPLRDHERLAVARELAIAGKRTEARSLLAQIPTPSESDLYAYADYIETLAALGRIDEIWKHLTTAPIGSRLRLAAAWTEAAIRTGRGLSEAKQALVDQLGVTQDPDWQPLRLLRRAEVHGRLGELTDLLDAIEGAHLAGMPSTQRAWTLLHLALYTGDQELYAEAAQVRTPVLRRAALVHAAPIADAVAAALTARYPAGELGLIWGRSMAGSAQDRAAFAAGVCPSSAAQPTAPAAGVALSAIETGGTSPGCFERDVELSLGGAATETKLVMGRCLAGEQTVAGRQVAVLENTGTTGSRTKQRGFQLAFEACSRIFVSSEFGRLGKGTLTAADLDVVATPDGRELAVEVSAPSYVGYAYRVSLPVCPAAPSEYVTDLGT